MRSPLRPCATTAVMVLVFSLSVPAAAQDHARDGAYLGGSLLGGTYTYLDEALFGGSVDETTLGFDVYAGYRLHPNFAVEGEFEMLPETQVSGFGFDTDLRTLNATVNMKVFALTGRIQPHVVAGAGVMDAEFEDQGFAGSSDSESDFTARLGGGVDVYLTENVALSVGLDYVIPTGDLNGLEYVSYGGGLLFRF